MRVTGGWARGARLAAPRDLRVRPTSDRVREAVFSSLGSLVAGARVLDLYAGTGALGCEALSRGAESAVFVEMDPLVLRVLRRNCGEMIRRGAPESGIRIVAADAERALARFAAGGERFDLVMADPPYRAAGGRGGVPAARVMERVAALDLLEPGGVLVLEHASGDAIETVAGCCVLRHHRYGGTAVTFAGRKARSG